MSQERLADLAGVHRTYLNSVELGKRNVSLINIELAMSRVVEEVDVQRNLAGSSRRPSTRFRESND
jgi:transcriptional regulator with XRE-family HTH domain